MNSLVGAFPDCELHVILDNLNTHKKNEHWLKKHPYSAPWWRGVGEIPPPFSPASANPHSPQSSRSF
jgi:hypothetical protein